MKTTRKILFYSLFAMLIASASCQKKGGSLEENLVVETTPLANGHLEAPAPGPDFPLRINVKSAMPAGGVKIDVSATPDGGSVAFFNTSLTTTNAVTDITITSAPPGVVSVVNITVTSVTTSSNKWTGNYKLSRK